MLDRLVIDMVFIMEEDRFHTVDRAAIQRITVEDILTAKGIAPHLDYSVPVPTSFQGIPHGTQEVWLQVKCGSIDSGAIDGNNPTLEQYRGRIGGC